MRTGPKSLTGLGSPTSLRGPIAALSKGGGVYPPLPAGYAFRTFGGVPLNLNGTYPIYKVS